MKTNSSSSNSMNLIDNLSNILNNIFSLENSSLNDFSSNEELQHCFKVLIFDDKVYNILSPMLKVYSLRDHNICFNLNIKDQRTRMPNVMAIYIISPSSENFQLLACDLKNNIFDNFSINIISYDSSEQTDKQKIQSFYSEISNLDIVNNIYNISIVPIDLNVYHPKIFTLDIKKPYLFLNSPNISDGEYNRYLTNLSNGIFSSLYILKSLPIIKYRNGYFAEDIIKKIQSNFNYLFEKFPEKKDEFIMRKNNSHNLLIFLDRDSDLPIMLHHASSLGSMLIDNFGLCRYKNDPNEEKFEVDPVNDYIWNSNLAEPFYKTRNFIFEEYKKYYNDMKYLDKVTQPKDMEQLAKESEKLAQSIETLRDKKLMGNILTQESNFITKLAETAEKRNLGQLYECEDLLLRKRNFVTNDLKKKFFDILKKYPIAKYPEMKEDLYRLCLIYYLCNNSISENEIKDIKQYLSSEKIIDYLKFKSSQSKQSNKQNSQKTNYLHSGLLYVMNSLNSLMTVEQPSVSADIINNLINNKAVDNFSTYNLFKKSVDKENLNYSYNEIMVFFIGGGSLGEYEYIDLLLQKGNKNVMYGCDYLYRPTEFINDLEELGKINHNN